MNVTEEQIAAFADGELSGDERARVEAAIAADPVLADKVEMHRRLRNTLGVHFAPVLDQKVPDRLTAILKPSREAEPSEGSAEVVSFAAERQKRGLAPMVRRWAPIAGPALAASLVLAIIQPWNTGSVPAGYADGTLAAALDDQLVATQVASADTRILVSFENEGGELCRAYRSGDTGGIACRDATGWDIQSEFALDGEQVTEFRQSGSEADVMAAAQAMAAGDALDSDAEAAAGANGWR